MNPEQWDQVRSLFERLVGLPSYRRLELLASVGPQLRGRVESLLAAHDQDGALDQPVLTTIGRPSTSAVTEGQVFGSFEVSREIGRGGMGVVYLARDLCHRRSVALKFLSANLEFDERSIRRLQREARLAAAIDHPNVCRMMGMEEEEGRHFVVMEYIEGETLRQRLKKGPFGLTRGLEIVRQIAEGVEAAHRLDIIHRDLKPQNIMLTADNQIKVMDFGLAKKVGPQPVEEKITQTGTAIGTINYMSPEQLKRNRVDLKSDIFSAAILVHEILAGKHPFGGKTDFEQAEGILREHPVHLNDPSTPIPGQLKETIRSMLEKSPERRLRSVSELLLRIRRLQESNPSSSS